MDLMANGRSALLAFQRALTTTSHNIANVFTEGYTRQTVNFSARDSIDGSNATVGAGVEIKTITRAFDQNMTENVRDNTTEFSKHELSKDLIGEIDQLLSSPSSGLAVHGQEFFNAMQEVANDPTSIAVREAMIGKSETLTNRYNEVGKRLSEIDGMVNEYLEESVSSINDLSRKIAQVNGAIMDKGSDPNDVPNSLLDQRDLLIEQLSKHITVKVVDLPDGSNSVYVGSGQSVVVGAKQNNISISVGDFGGASRKIGYTNSSGDFVDVTKQISGGRIGSALDFKNGVLQKAMDDVDMMATGLATMVNESHTSGYGLKLGDPANTGNVFFTATLAPSAFGSADNSAGSSVTLNYATPAEVGGTTMSDVVSKWQSAEYYMDYDGTNWSVTNFRTKENVNFATSGSDLLFDGLKVTVNAAAAGDSFRLTPFKDNAFNLKTEIADPELIAAASADNQPGNNLIGQQIADLSESQTFNNGTNTISEVYGQLVSYIGAKGSTVNVSYDASKVMMDQAKFERDDFSGVNLDEEAADLLKFQQAYQAAAKVMSAADNMFTSLLSSIRV